MYAPKRGYNVRPTEQYYVRESTLLSDEELNISPTHDIEEVCTRNPTKLCYSLRPVSNTLVKL